jgi:DNA-binding response OmpR family regulator
MEILIIVRRDKLASYNSVLHRKYVNNIDCLCDLDSGIDAMRKKHYHLIIVEYDFIKLDFLKSLQEFKESQINANTSIAVIVEEKQHSQVVDLSRLLNNIHVVNIDKTNDFCNLAVKLAIKSYLEDEDKVRILCIEDSIDDFELYARILSLIFENYSIDHSYSVQDGLIKIKQNSYNLIMLDYNLESGLTGADFLYQKPSHVETPIIALTGQGSQSLAATIMLLGAGDYIVKSDITALSLSYSIFNVFKRFHQNRIIQEKQSELLLFAHTIAHDIKAPISRINSYAQQTLKST